MPHCLAIFMMESTQPNNVAGGTVCTIMTNSSVTCHSKKNLLTQNVFLLHYPNFFDLILTKNFQMFEELVVIVQ
jgi:hypothetical protein